LYCKLAVLSSFDPIILIISAAKMYMEAFEAMLHFGNGNLCTLSVMAADVFNVNKEYEVGGAVSAS
jgi:hypothetical protein